MFKEIVLYKNDAEYLGDIWKKNRVGHIPCYIKLHSDLSTGNKLNDTINKITESLQIYGVDPRSPYPIYLVSEKILDGGELPIIAKIEDLPKHFIYRSKIPSSKERKVMQKIDLYKEQLLTHDSQKLFANTEEIKKLQKKYHNLLKEIEFYSQLLNLDARTEYGHWNEDVRDPSKFNGPARNYEKDSSPSGIS